MNLLSDIAIEGAALLLLAATAAWLLRRRSAAVRHITWLMAFAGLLILPALSLLAPRWRLPILPTRATEISNLKSQIVPTLFPSRSIGAMENAEPAGMENAGRIEQRIAASPNNPGDRWRGELHVHPENIQAPVLSAFGQHISVNQWPLMAWLIGALLVFGKVLIGSILAVRLRHKAISLEQQPWNTLANSLANSLGLRHSVQLLICSDSTMPMAMGLFRPAILLPAEARQWSDEKRRMVLLHELAHVRRRDCLSSVLAQFALALHWFDPLAWLAMRRLIIERELACDDVVLSTGSPSSHYAGCLLDIARQMQAATLIAAAIPMARPGQLEGRLLAILDAARPRSVMTRRMVMIGLIIMALLALPLAAVRLTAAQSKNLYQPITAEDRPTSDITGIVTDESGKAVTGVKVLAVEAWEKNPQRQATSTDPQGHFIFKNLKAGYWSFFTDDPRFAWQWNHEYVEQVPIMPENLPVNIRLYEPRTLHGTVVNENGHPVPDVQVAVVNEILPGHTNPVSDRNNVDFVVAHTDAAGQFTLHRLRPGQAVLVLRHPDYAWTLAEANVNGKDATLTIQKGLTLLGHVVSNGKPLANVAVSAKMDEACGLLVNWHGKTDADGDFEVPRIPSQSTEYRANTPTVDVMVQDNTWHSAHYDVYQMQENSLPPVTIEAYAKEKGKNPPPTFIDINKPLIPLASKSTPSGKLVVHVPGLLLNGRVDADAVSLPISEKSLDVSQEINKQTAVFDGLPAGRYMISTFGGTYTTSLPGRPPKSIELAAGQKLDVTLEPGPDQIRGMVRSGGKPISGGNLSWFIWPHIHGAVFQGGVDVRPDGSYTIGGLTDGEYQLVFETPGSMYNVFMVKVGKGTTSFDIELPSSRIDGTLIGRTPKPSEDPQNPWMGDISVTPRQESLKLAHAECLVKATPDGKFTVNYLPPGQYMIEGYDLVTSVTIPRKDSMVSAVLRPPEKFGEIAGNLTGNFPKVRDDWNAISITAFPRDQFGYNFDVYSYRAELSAHNTYRFRNLPVGTYGLYLSSSFNHPPDLWIGTVEVREGLVRQLPIHIPAEREISILPENARGYDSTKPACNGWRLLMPTGDWLDAKVLTNGLLIGEFSLPMGQYTVEADYGPRGIARQTFTVVPGQGTQKIEIEELGPAE